MTNDSPLYVVLVVASVVGSLLLVAPWVPPQLGFFAFVAVFAVGVMAYYGLYHVGSEILEGWREAKAEAEPEPTEVERVQQRYVDGELTEDEFERELEKLEDEIH